MFGPFGAAGDLFLWQGPTSITLNSETKANGTFALAKDGLHINQAAALPPVEDAQDSVVINSTSDTEIVSFALTGLLSGDKIRVSIFFPNCETDTTSTILWTLTSDATTLAAGSVSCPTSGSPIHNDTIYGLNTQLFTPAAVPSTTIYLYGRRSSGIIDVALDANILVEVIRSGITFLPP